MKLIYGVYHPDEGTIDGRRHGGRARRRRPRPAPPASAWCSRTCASSRRSPSPRTSRSRSTCKGFRFDRTRAGRRRSARPRSGSGSPVDPNALVRDLSIGERQRVEILKVLMAGARLVILDEPTSVLAPQEVDALFAGVERLRARGPVGRDHHPQAARGPGDRRPRARCCAAASSSSAVRRSRDLDRRRAGRGDGRAARCRRCRPSATRRRTEGVAGARARRRHGVVGSRDAPRARPTSTLTVRRRRARRRRRRRRQRPARAVRGDPRAAARSRAARIDGRRARRSAAQSPRDARAAGAVGVPEDPVEDAVVPGLDVASARRARRPPDVPQRPRHRLDARCATRTVEISDEHRAAHGRAPPRGGDAVGRQHPAGHPRRARSAADSCRVLVAAYPSRGLDIATTRRTQELLLEQRAAGAGVLLISEDLDELLELSDRIAVLHDGRIAGDRRAARPPTPTRSAG